MLVRGRLPQLHLLPTLWLGKPSARQSLEWFRNGEIERVERYCRQDVELLQGLLTFAGREGHVRIKTREGTAVRIPVEWSPENLASCIPSTHPPAKVFPVGQSCV